ncbi:hypothetical protein GCM10008018_60340 [Paenibacillus marchantiophytorum]|uniref:Uncharacterized protein n=1 Tax=Paenibacillus marchantiophytorum TaxID=1619310 RepID=A0ABQ1FBZ4_9BACL|nr:hypothetical protein [Paenibacillus marchantiophytorum]GGA06415.1 hypothetical protein GCM10008018_60340 [Paenibacillus marchantiophytorum]
MMETIEEIRFITAELGERVRQIRTERGQLPEPPDDFVSVPLSIVLTERLKPFEQIAIKYAGIIAEGHLISIDMSKLVEYRKTAALLYMSVGFETGMYASMVDMILREMDRVNSALESGNTDDTHAGEVLRFLHFAIEMMRGHSSVADAESKRLKEDAEVLETELSAAWAHYETIKHEI